MSPISISVINHDSSRPLMQESALDQIRNNLLMGGRRIAHFLDEHTDLVSSVGVLAVTTCLLAAKIFSSIPACVAKGARVFLNFGGIIWLNIQIKGYLKSCQDTLRFFRQGDRAAFIKTAMKVFVEGTNILLTSVYFGASIATLAGFPAASISIYMALRPLSLCAFSAQITGDIWDYWMNKKLLKAFDSIENKAAHRIAPLMRSYLMIVNPYSHKHDSSSLEIQKLASRTAGQLDAYNLNKFREQILQQDQQAPVRQRALLLYDDLKDRLINIQAGVKSRLCLIVLGYLAMGVGRLYPDSLIETCSRWSLSVLYTDELIKYKLRSNASKTSQENDRTVE